MLETAIVQNEVEKVTLVIILVNKDTEVEADKELILPIS